MPLTNTERQRRYVHAQLDRGLMRACAYVYPGQAKAIHAFAKKLRAEHEQAREEELRNE